MEKKRRKPFCAAAAIVSLAVAGCSPPSSGAKAQILLFNGTGTSPNDVAAVEAILKGKQLDYATVDSRQLNRLSETQLMACRLIIIPGGNFLDMGNGLASGTLTNLHNAVEKGVNYLGICAGGLLAGHGPYNSLNLTSGIRFDFYGVVNQGVHKGVVAITVAGSPALEHYWEDGPQFSGWGEVVGKYPDDTPAVVQGPSRQGVGRSLRHSSRSPGEVAAGHGLQHISQRCQCLCRTAHRGGLQSHVTASFLITVQKACFETTREAAL